MSVIDNRIITVGFEINGVLKTYSSLGNGFNIHAHGSKYGDPTQNECEVDIENLDNSTINYLLTATSPFNPNRTPKKMIINAGRVSTGVSLIYQGNITSVIASQPPDIKLKIKALTDDFQKGNIVARSQPPQTKLSTLCKQVALDNNLTLNFQADDKLLANYTFTGGSLKQINKLQEVGGLDVFSDNNQLIVKNHNKPLPNRLKILNLDTGMIGIPELTEQGIKVKFLLDKTTVLGGAIQLTSKLYPAFNGLYTIYQLDFDIMSRGVHFYWIASCTRANSNG